MKSRLVSVFLIALGVIVWTGCAKVQEPWDAGNNYKQERARSDEQERMLRHRVMVGQAER